jgi:hypothetical protein
MHLYTVPKGTQGKLLAQRGADSAPAVEDWITRKELTFTEFVIDPVWYHNNRGKVSLPIVLEQMAQQGYAVYGGDTGGLLSAKYLLAVPYDSVHVL